MTLDAPHGWPAQMAQPVIKVPNFGSLKYSPPKISCFCNLILFRDLHFKVSRSYHLDVELLSIYKLSNIWSHFQKNIFLFRWRFAYFKICVEWFMVVHKENSNKMQQCIKILLFHIYMKLNMFRATFCPSSGA
jgi:hypothetical protein